MPRALIFGLLLLVGCATRPQGTQSVPLSVAPVPAIDPRISETLRQRLSVGYDGRREPGGLEQHPASARSLAQVFALPPRMRAEPERVPGSGPCPILGALPDPRAIESTPTARVDMTRIEKMPVSPGTCNKP